MAKFRNASSHIKYKFYMKRNFSINQLVYAITIILIMSGTYGCSNGIEEPTINFVIGKYYVRKVISDKEDPFETPEIDTIIILDKKNGYIKWTKKNWQNDSNFWISTREKHMAKLTKPCH